MTHLHTENKEDTRKHNNLDVFTYDKQNHYLNN